MSEPQSMIINTCADRPESYNRPKKLGE